MRILRYERRDTSSNLVKPAWMNSLMEKRLASNEKIESSSLSSSSIEKDRETMACSLMVRAVALYAKGYWFESSQANKHKPVAQRKRQ